MFSLRFDMRAPADGPATTAELYGAAVEMAAWADQRPCSYLMVSEHHGAPDGYLPSPMVLASAMAARTSRVPIIVGALLLPMYDPIKLAEDMVILDIVSGGRVRYIIGLGYRSEEYAMFGVDMRRRGQVMEAKLDALIRARRGEELVYEGRPVRVTPQPFTPGGPALMYGGHTVAAARRAGRFGLDLFAERGDESLAVAYREAASQAGHEPGHCHLPSSEHPTSLFIAEDPDAAWKELGPFLLHDALMYGEWMGSGREAASRSQATSIEGLRDEGRPYRIVTPDQARSMREAGIPLSMQPLCGGLPPDLAWRSLALLDEQVLDR